MKLTDPGIIQEGEKDLIDAIKDDLDLDAINEVIKDKLKVKNLESKGGKIIVHNNKIAFKLDFELSLNGSLMFDRDGNYIPDSHDDGINDTEDDAKRLCKMLAPIKAKINLIPFNEHDHTTFKKPSKERISKFLQILLDENFTAIIRKSKGEDISAACGQLKAKLLIKNNN